MAVTREGVYAAESTRFVFATTAPYFHEVNLQQQTQKQGLEKTKPNPGTLEQGPGAFRHLSKPAQ